MEIALRDSRCERSYDFEVHEENAWVKVIDAVIGELPIIGMFTGYLFNPAYIVSRTDNTPVARLQKQPAFFEGKFRRWLSDRRRIEYDEEKSFVRCVLM